MKYQHIIGKLAAAYPVLEPTLPAVTAAIDALIATYEAGGKLLLCGNGGSCADCDHISGELLKGFLLPRKVHPDVFADMPSSELADSIRDKLQGGLCAIPLNNMTAVLSAFANDADPTLGYAQLTLAMGKPGDALLTLSTSGNARNCLAAAHVALSQRMTLIAMTGRTGGALGELCKHSCSTTHSNCILINVPADETYIIQELHLPVYHAICAAVEHHFFA